MCVDSEYPTARVDVRDVSGPPGVRMFVAYTGTHSWGNPSAAGNVPGSSSWTVSPPIQLHPGNLYGWQEAQYTFEGGPKGGVAQLYDFYVDPRCRLSVRRARSRLRRAAQLLPRVQRGPWVERRA